MKFGRCVGIAGYQQFLTVSLDYKNTNFTNSSDQTSGILAAILLSEVGQATVVKQIEMYSNRLES